MTPTLNELLNLLERAVAEPERLRDGVDAFLRAYWQAHEAIGEDWLPWGTPLHDEIHDLGGDLQDYQAPGEGPLEPTLLHDSEVLARITHVLEMAGRPTGGTSRSAV
jgi:hypothetical protein